jgi:hypothetical protein
VIEIDHEGRTVNAWSDCDVIDEGASHHDVQPAPGATPAPNVALSAKAGRKPAVGNSTKKFLEERYPAGRALA